MNSHGWDEIDLQTTEIFARDMAHNHEAGSSSGFQFQVNSTTAVINELRLSAAQQERVSIVILASFNVAIAFATVVGIVWDSYKRARRETPGFSFLRSPLSLIRPAETFPLILCCGIVAQGITFAIAQSKGLSALSILGCETISQLMLPATLITPSIQFVLAVEISVRAAMRRPFPARPPWLIWVCVVIIGTGLLIAYIIALVFRPPNFCYVSLFWLVTRWKLGVFVIWSVITGILMISCVLVFVRLHQHPEVALKERLTASRMMFYLTSSVVANLFIIPFFWSLNYSDLATAGDQPWQLSMAATVVVNVTGMVTGGIWLFLRSDKMSNEIVWRDEEYYDTKGDKRWEFKNGSDDGIYEKELPPPPMQKLRLQKVNSNEALMAQIAQPVSPPRPFPPSPVDLSPLERNKVQDKMAFAMTTEQYDDQADGRVLEDRRSQYQASIKDSRAAAVKARKMSYSIFPTEDPNQNKSMILLPAATYDPSAGGSNNPQAYLDTLPPPPSLRLPEHRRKSSTNSTATVQIGLRLSNVNDMPRMSSAEGQEIVQVHNLGCPTYESGRSKGASPLAQTVMNSRGSEFINSPVMTSADVPSLPTLTRDSIDGFGEIRLSPTVYSPEPPKTRSKPATPVEDDLSDAIPRPLVTKKRDWI